MTLREFLLDSSFVPPLVEYTVEKTDGVHHARVAIAGVAYAGTAARFLFRLLSAKSLLFVLDLLPVDLSCFRKVHQHPRERRQS